MLFFFYSFYFLLLFNLTPVTTNGLMLPVFTTFYVSYLLSLSSHLLNQVVGVSVEGKGIFIQT